MLDYHVHLWPHSERAESSELRLERLKRYCDQAQAAGVAEIALTEHFFRFRNAMSVVDKFWRRPPTTALSQAMASYFDFHSTADLDEYVEAVLEAKKAGLPVILGLEVDYYAGQMDVVETLLSGYPFDVLLGSVHWIGTWMFDNIESEEVMAEWDRRGVEDTWRAYTESLEELAATRTCDVLAHPDLVKILGKRPPPTLLEECHDRMAQAAASSAMAAELSSAGYRKPVASAYPDQTLLDRFCRAGVPLTTASDAHGTSNVAERADDLSKMARAAGYETLRAFRARTAYEVPLAAVTMEFDLAVAMTSPADLARDYTGLDLAARNHLERLMGSWEMLADFSFSDLLLYAPLDRFSLVVADASDSPLSGGAGGSIVGEPHFVVLGQMRPTTSQTLFDLDLVGQVHSSEELFLVGECWSSGTILSGERPSEADAGVIYRYQSIPVRWHNEVIAVLSRIWSPTAGRRTGGLERTYVRLFDRFATMVSDGVFPFVTDEAAIEEAPRVGDGVIALDAEQKIIFASPNVVNALHRTGIVSSIVGSNLSGLGLETDVVRTAFSRHLPMIEEIERRGDVIVTFRCIPLIADGKVTGAALLLRDVTDLRRRDRLIVSKDAAIREVHHRVKNNLQTISSLLRLQSRRVEDRSTIEALLEAERRISAIALVHEILAHEPGEQVPFDEIIPALVRMAKEVNVHSENVSVRVIGDAGDVVADVATPLAVVLAELLQNAVEHAFASPAGREQVVEIQFENTNSELAVTVRDNGVGFPEGFSIEDTKSLGLAIVRDLVCSQLGGVITVENGVGAVVRLVIPLDSSRPLPHS